jgi:hypothetical protein
LKRNGNPCIFGKNSRKTGKQKLTKYLALTSFGGHLELSVHVKSRLCLIHDKGGEAREPKIICSMGLLCENK